VEQDQIGEEELPAPFQLPGRLLEPGSNVWPRRMVATPQGAQKPAYRSPDPKYKLSYLVLFLDPVEQQLRLGVKRLNLPVLLFSLTDHRLQAGEIECSRGIGSRWVLRTQRKKS
jgi:hypothetical protein